MKTLIVVQKYRCPWNTHSRCQHWSSEPDSVPLHVMGDDLHIDGLGLQNKDDLCSTVYWKGLEALEESFLPWSKVFHRFMWSCPCQLLVLLLPPYLQLPTAQLFAYFQSCVHSPLQVPLQASAEVPEHGGASGEHDILWHNTKWLLLCAACPCIKQKQTGVCLPCREDAWRRWDSSGWLHPPPLRWAGWSLGWQTGWKRKGKVRKKN